MFLFAGFCCICRELRRCRMWKRRRKKEAFGRFRMWKRRRKKEAFGRCRMWKRRRKKEALRSTTGYILFAYSVCKTVLFLCDRLPKKRLRNQKDVDHEKQKLSHRILRHPLQAHLPYPQHQLAVEILRFHLHQIKIKSLLQI